MTMERAMVYARHAGFLEGEQQTRLETAKIALMNKISFEMIQRLTGFSSETIRDLQIETLCGM